MRALVLGGRGDIGGAIAERLSAAGMDVVAVGHIDFDLSKPSEIDSFFSGGTGKRTTSWCTVAGSITPNPSRHSVTPRFVIRSTSICLAFCG